MTPELVELARWVSDTIPLSSITRLDTITANVGGHDRAVADLTSWRTYGVLRGVLAGICPYAEVVRISDVWGVSLYGDRDAEAEHPPYKPTMIEAVIAAIRYLKEHEDE